MPITYTDNGGGAANGSDLEFTFTFPVLQTEDVKVALNGVTQATTKYAVDTASNPTKITFNNTSIDSSVQETSGAPKSGVLVRVYRQTTVGKSTGDDDPKAVYAAGSSIRAVDLNSNTEQALYAIHELQNNPVLAEQLDTGAITSDKILNGTIATTDIADSAITSIKIAAGAVETTDLAGSAVTHDKLANNAVETGNIVDSNVTTAKIADANVTTAKIAADAVTTDKIGVGQVTAARLASDSVSTAKIVDANVTTAKIAADAVTNAKIADDSIDSEHYVDGSIDTAHIGNLQVTTDKLADASVNNIKLANNSIDQHHYQDGSIKTEHITDGNITSAKIAANAVTTDKIADSELSTLAGMQSTTASNLASSTALTATTAELNQLDGITLETSVTTNSDTRIPTSKAVNDLVLSVTNALGGFVAIANETSFPTTNPDPSNNAGTVVSISQLSTGLAVNSSGIATISNGAGTGNTVTITGFPSNLQSQTLPASSGLQVQTTSTLHTYTFHKQLASAADIQAISATVNSFSNRYRVSASAPTSSLDGGDLWYDTTNSKLMVYSSQNSAWEESSAIGNFFISTISSSSNTGGGSATPNGTAYRFTISNAPTDAQQLLVSVDGVIQKPNAGSSQPSEGFVLVGNDIIFGSAPANGASIFVTVIGSTVGIGTPSDNTVTTAILQNGSVTTAKIVDANVSTAKIADSAVTSAKIADGTIVNADVNASAAIAGTKISPDFGSQAITTTGNLNAKDIVLTDTTPGISFVDSNNNPDFKIIADNGILSFVDTTNNANRINIQSDGHVDIVGNLDVGAGLDVTGVIETTVAGADNMMKIKTTSSGDPILQFNAAGSGGHDIYYNRSTNELTFKSAGGSDRLKISPVGDLLPAIDSQYNIGSNTVRFANIYADTLYGNGANLTGINTDLVSDTSPQLGGTLDTNGNMIRFPDATGVNVNRLKFGTGDDLHIYHNGTDSTIRHEGTGKLVLQTTTGNIELRDNAEDMIVAKGDGAVELYHNGTKKFETASGGCTVTGTLSTSGVSISNGAGAVTLNGGSDIRFSNGSWTGDACKIQHYSSWLYLQGGGNGIVLRGSTSDRWYVNSNGHFYPAVNNSFDIGIPSSRVRNLYTNDLHLSNEGSSNDIDGSWGDWTIQEGESDLFLKNNRSGKKYKFNLTEVS